jgi:hypothetical protein
MKAAASARDIRLPENLGMFSSTCKETAVGKPAAPQFVLGTIKGINKFQRSARCEAASLRHFPSDVAIIKVTRFHPAPLARREDQTELAATRSLVTPATGSCACAGVDARRASLMAIRSKITRLA